MVTIPPDGTTLIEKLRDNLYVLTTGGPTRTNITVFVTENNGVVMFETGDPGWGEAWLGALKTITTKPLTRQSSATRTPSLAATGFTRR